MTPDELLTAIHARGVTLAANGDRLKVDAPVGSLTDELRAELKRHKAVLLVQLDKPAMTLAIEKLPDDPDKRSRLWRLVLDRRVTEFYEASVALCQLDEHATEDECNAASDRLTAAQAAVEQLTREVLA